MLSAVWLKCLLFFEIIQFGRHRASAVWLKYLLFFRAYLVWQAPCVGCMAKIFSPVWTYCVSKKPCGVYNILICWFRRLYLICAFCFYPLQLKILKIFVVTIFTILFFLNFNLYCIFPSRHLLPLNPFALNTLMI